MAVPAHAVRANRKCILQCLARESASRFMSQVYNVVALHRQPKLAWTYLESFMKSRLCICPVSRTN